MPKFRVSIPVLATPRGGDEVTAQADVCAYTEGQAVRALTYHPDVVDRRPEPHRAKVEKLND